MFNVLLIAAAALAAGLYFKKEATLEFLQNAKVWAVGVAVAAADYFNVVDLSKILDVFK